MIMTDLKRVVVLPRTAEIKEMYFPTRPDLVGICSHEKGGFISRAQYDSVATRFDSMAAGPMKDLYGELAKICVASGNTQAFEQGRDRLLSEHGKEFGQTGLSLHPDDLYVVNDHVHNNGKEYNAVIIDVKSHLGVRSVRGDCSPAALAFNLGENFTAAERLTDVMRLSDASRIAEVLRGQGLGPERANNAAPALAQNALTAQL